MAKEDLPRRRTTIHDISDDLLDLILLHIPSAVALVRAAATCKLWRRAIGATVFLRRYRRLHGQHILGHYHSCYQGFRPSFVPLAAPPGEEPAVGDIRDDRVSVSFDFFPDIHYRMESRLTDSRGGLLAFVRRNWSVIVCCPWTREYRELYHNVLMGNTSAHCLAAFLLDGDDETGQSTGLAMSNFRVLYVELVRHDRDGSQTAHAWFFSAGDNRSLRSSTRNIDDIIPDADIFPPPFSFVGRAGGSLCWSSQVRKEVLLLDERTGEFSVFALPGYTGINKNPLSYNRWNLRVIGGDDVVVGTVHLARIVDDDLEVLRYGRRGGARACVVERRIRVSSQMPSIDKNRQCHFLDTAEATAPGRIGIRDILQGDLVYIWMFSVDFQNWKLERVQEMSRHGGLLVFLYELPWTISSCL